MSAWLLEDFANWLCSQLLITMVKFIHLLAVACLFLCIEKVPGENRKFSLTIGLLNWVVEFSLLSNVKELDLVLGYHMNVH